MELNLVLSKQVGNVTVDGYYGAEQAWFTREQIGEQLEYSDPTNAISKIHNCHRELLDLPEFSGVVKLSTPQGGTQDVFVYSFKGVLEICRWSRQANANKIMQALYDMAEEIRTKGYYSILSDDKLVEMLIEKGKNGLTAHNIMAKAMVSSYRDNPHTFNGLSTAEIKSRSKTQAEWDAEKLYENRNDYTYQAYMKELWRIYVGYEANARVHMNKHRDVLQTLPQEPRKTLPLPEHRMITVPTLTNLKSATREEFLQGAVDTTAWSFAGKAPAKS
jgi:prophage antirepressor-like protein